MYTLLLLCSVLLLAVFTFQVFFRSLSLRRVSKENGCGRPRYEDSSDPLGIVKAVEVFRNFRQGRFLTYTDHLFEKYGETYVSTILGQKIVYTSDPRNIKHVLSTGFEDFDSSAFKAPLFQPITPHGIFNADGAKWKHLRELFRTQFSNTRAISDLDMHEGHVQNLLRRLTAAKGEKIDLQPLFLDLAADIISSFTTGESFDLLAKTNILPEKRFFASDMQLVRDTIARDGYLGPLRHLLNRRPFFKACANIQRHVSILINRSLVSRHIKQLQQNSGSHHSRRPSATGYTFLDGLVGHTQDPFILRDSTTSVLVAGVDAVASLLSAIFWLLSRNPRVYAKLREEVLTSIGPTCPPTYDQLRNLRYMRSVIKEGQYRPAHPTTSPSLPPPILLLSSFSRYPLPSPPRTPTDPLPTALRCLPPTPLNIRTARHDTILPHGGIPSSPQTPSSSQSPPTSTSPPILIPASTKIIISPYSSHHNRQTFSPDPWAFRPERWEETDAETGKLRLNAEPVGFVPFSAGPRACPGREWAMVEVGFVVGRVVQGFEGVGTWRGEGNGGKEGGKEGEGEGERWVEELGGLTLRNGRGVWVVFE